MRLEYTLGEGALGIAGRPLAIATCCHCPEGRGSSSYKVRSQTHTVLVDVIFSPSDCTSPPKTNILPDDGSRAHAWPNRLPGPTPPVPSTLAQ